MVFGYKCACCGNVFGDDRAPGNAPGNAGGENLPFSLTCGECDSSEAPLDLSIYTINAETQVVFLEATEAFNGLTTSEKAYAYALGMADWEGAKICLLQCSAEAAGIFSLLQLVFSAQPLETLKAAAAARDVSDADWDAALLYAAAFYGNMGNYKSFGDTKFVPTIATDKFEAVCLASAAPAEKVAQLHAEVSDRMYSLPPRQRVMWPAVMRSCDHVSSGALYSCRGVL
jgi:dipeptidyl-peptidase-3